MVESRDYTHTHLTKHYSRVIGLLVIAMLCLLFAANVQSSACENVSCMVDAAGRLSPLAGLSIGIAILLIAMAVEWNAILNNVRLNEMSLNVVENEHPRLPRTFEIIIAGMLTAALCMLFVQFILTVYAMSFTLNSSTVETKDTKQMLMGDFDGDGDLDYVAGNADNGNAYMLDLYSNDGTGTFSNATFGSSDVFQEAESGDIDGDGDLDLISAYTAGGALARLKNNGAGTFVSSDFSSTTIYDTLLLQDFNNDASLDVMAAGSNYALFLNTGHGNFVQTGSYLPPLADMAAADFNSDGYLDVATSDASQNFRVYLNSGTGSFTRSYNTVLGSTGPIITGDFDGDGNIDVVASDATNQLLVEINNGNGTSFGLPSGGGAVASNLNAVRSLAAGDVDNDGDLDVIASGGPTAGGARLFLNDGIGNLTENGVATETSDSTYGIAVGDIDGDGDLDYVRGNDDTPSGAVNRHYKSDQAATSANTAPTAPSLSTLTGAYVPPSPKGPVVSADDAGIGTVTWGSLANATVSDDAFASLALNPSAISHYLKVTDFRFNVPAGATILGIKAEVERKNGSTGQVQDNAVRLVKGGTIQSTDRSAAGDWPTTFDAYQTYGGNTDLWGTTWTPSDINGNDFGFAISVVNPSGSNPTPSVQIDYVRITVYYNMASIRLSWGSGSDTETPTKMLQYQLQMGTGSNSHSFYSGKTSSPNWVTRVVPNGQSRTELLRNVPCGHTYYWSVAAVDTGFKSTRSAEKTLTLDSGCTFSVASSSSVVSGGGTMWKVPKPILEPVVAYGHLHLSAFEDINANGVKDLSENNGFPGLAITASGSTASGAAVRTTIVLSENGEGSFALEPSDARGYALFFDTGSTVLQGFVFLGGTASGSHVVDASTNESLSFGFRRSSLLSYKPCLDIVDPGDVRTGKSDAALLLHRLQGPYSSFVTDGLSLSGSLVTRRDFLTLLQRTQCIPLLTNPMELMREAFAARFIDVPPMFMGNDSIMLYSLLHAGLPVARETVAGPAADLTSPVSRREAVALLRIAMGLEPMEATDQDVLPIDLQPDDSVVPDFLALKKAGVLPKSFLHVFGPEQGIDPVEMPILLTRSAFRTGHISLLPPSFEDNRHAAASEEAPSFMDLLPAFPERTCLERDKKRPERITFSDLLPADPLEAGVRALLGYGVINDDGKMLWLLPATKKPTEFGIQKGSIALSPDQPVSMVEILRSLLVLRCLPPPPARETVPSLLGSAEVSQGTRVFQDALSGLPRDTTFQSRTFYRAQDHERAFNLSLFSFAPHLLLRDPVAPESMLSIEDGSDLLASAALNVYVHEGLLNPQEAENMAAELSVALRKEFLGEQSLDQARLLPLTRRMLLEFLSALLVSKDGPEETPGEVWWKRVEV